MLDSSEMDELTIYADYAQYRRGIAGPVMLLAEADLATVVVTDAKGLPLSHSAEPLSTTVSKRDMLVSGELQELSDDIVILRTTATEDALGPRKLSIRKWRELWTPISEALVLAPDNAAAISYLTTAVKWRPDIVGSVSSISRLGSVSNSETTMLTRQTSSNSSIPGTNSRSRSPQPSSSRPRSPQLVTSSNRQELRLQLRAVIENDTGVVLPANTLLVAGGVYRSENNKGQARALMAASSPVSDSSATEEYLSYRLGAQELRRHNIVELGAWTTACEKVYLHNIGETATEWGYRFLAPDLTPAASLTVYRDGVRLGAADVVSARSGEPVTAVLGQTSQISCSSSVSSAEATIETKQGGTRCTPTVDGSVKVNSVTLEAVISGDPGPVENITFRFWVGRAAVLSDSCGGVRRGAWMEWVTPIQTREWCCALQLSQ